MKFYTALKHRSEIPYMVDVESVSDSMPDWFDFLASVEGFAVCIETRVVKIAEPIDADYGWYYFECASWYNAWMESNEYTLNADLLIENSDGVQIGFMRTQPDGAVLVGTWS